MIKLIALLGLATLPFLYLNCSGDDASEFGAIQIPTAQSKCQSLAAAGCTTFNSNKLLFVGITDDTSKDCGIYMSRTNTSQLYQLFIASSISVTQFNTTHAYLFTSHSEWTTSTNSPATVLENKEYLFCAFIDSNNDSFLNAGEPILRQQHALSDLNHINLESWGDN